MTRYVFLLSLLTCFELLYFRVAHHFNIIDKPNDRSSHTKITIRGGGIIFWVAAITYFVYAGFIYPYFFVGLTLVALISFMDDIFTLSNRYRLFFQFLALGLIIYQICFNVQGYYFFIGLSIVSVGILNAYNFMDGINGMTGGYSLICLCSLLYVNNYCTKFIDNDFIIFISLSVLVFNFFNFRKQAKCFAGDVGSISIAFIIIFLLIKIILLTNQYIYMLFLTLYGIDTIFTLLIRIWQNENIFTAHKKHFFQLLVHKCNFSHLTVSLLYLFVQLIINLFVISLVKFEQDSLYFSVSILTILSCLYIYYRKKVMKIALTIK